MADHALRDLPPRVSPAVVGKTVDRIAGHAASHNLPSVEIILYGGELLLAGTGWLADLIGSLRAQVQARVNVAVQTDGTLLDRSRLDILKKADVRAGVSLYGENDPGRQLRGAAGVQPSGARPAAAARKLGLPAAGHRLRGLADRRLRALVFGAARQETRIRVFGELIQLVLGQPGVVEGLGLLPSSILVIDTDGSIKQLDSLSSACPGCGRHRPARRVGQLRRRARSPTTVARQIGAEALSARCRNCEVMTSCGGDLDAHRYRRAAGFCNPCVYCDDLLRLSTHVRDRALTDEISPGIWRSVRPGQACQLTRLFTCSEKARTFRRSTRSAPSSAGP
jgi:uncharacterized protein